MLWTMKHTDWASPEKFETRPQVYCFYLRKNWFTIERFREVEPYCHTRLNAIKFKLSTRQRFIQIILTYFVFLPDQAVF